MTQPGFAQNDRVTYGPSANVPKARRSRQGTVVYVSPRPGYSGEVFVVWDDYIDRPMPVHGHRLELVTAAPASYWLITEPARRTSVRVNVAPGSDADESLLAYAKQWHPEIVAEWRDAGEIDRFDSYYSDATGEQIELIEETNFHP